MRFAIIALSCILLSPLAALADGFSVADFRLLHKQLQASNKEPWRTVPWITGLLDAQNQAAESKKPMFIWAMDGHPLGCT